MESRCYLTFPALQNILMDSTRTIAESTWNGHPPLSVQASGVLGAQKGKELPGQMWYELECSISGLCLGSLAGHHRKMECRGSPGIALNNECSGSYMYRKKPGSLHQLECGRIKDGNTGVDHSECQKGCWKMKKHSSRMGTVMQSLRDTANGMWDSSHHLLFIAHILLG